MKTCKDCLHYDVCQYHISEETEMKIEDGVCKDFADKAEWLRLPFPIGTQLYRVTHPYRKEPKVTEFIVTNFVMQGKKHELMVEVRVNGVPGKNVMHIKSFFRTKEEAVKALEEMKNYGK